MDEYITLKEYDSEKCEIFTRQVLAAFEKKLITATNCKSLLSQTERQATWDEVFDLYEQLVNDYIHALKHNDYYVLIERIDNGEKMLDETDDPRKKSEYIELLNDLYTKLEKLTPRGEAA